MDSIQLNSAYRRPRSCGPTGLAVAGLETKAREPEKEGETLANAHTETPGFKANSCHCFCLKFVSQAQTRNSELAALQASNLLNASPIPWLQRRAPLNQDPQ